MKCVTAPNIAGVVLLGAEGCSEIPDACDWARPSTHDEECAFRTKLQSIYDESGKKLDWGSVLVDHNGRPYWFYTVSTGAPDRAIEKAERYSRVVRLTD